LLRDNDGIFGNAFVGRVRSLGIRPLRTPVRAPKANAIAERFVGTLRRECLDHVFIFNERHLQKVVDEFVAYYNQQRPHRSLNQKPPLYSDAPPLPHPTTPSGAIVSEPVLGGLHHVYRRAA
jgi:transposase InsO family protein